MNPVKTVKTYARDGQQAGTAVNSSARAIRKRAARAGKQAKRVRKQLVEQLPDRTAEIARGARNARRSAQDTLTERLLDARHELAARIEPESRRRRRWPWMVLLLFGIAGVAGAAVLTRRPQQTEPEEFPIHPARAVNSSYNDQDAMKSSPTGNGVVSAGRSSSSAD
ncbi:MAG TPA: hypothetical protein VNA67_04305 [Pseudonocardiaceae bacterium]|nr:hypothetical protein [Pseudonocardiaceae bacterium]